MKRSLMVAGVVAAMILPAYAARRVSVAQVEEVVASAEAARRTDLDTAREIGDLEMTERLTDRTLVRLAAAHKLGPRTALALQLLSDQAAFLDPPASEFPATEFPDAETQERMLSTARAYSVQTWNRMPNFFVTRVTHRFDDAPHVIEKGGWPIRAGLEPVGSSSRQVTFRDGKEVQDNPATASAHGKADQELGLHSWGEFGPALFVVLSDLSKGKITFSHWEETDPSSGGNAATQPGLVAVFRYSVPRPSSHYSVNYCCTLDPKSIGSARVNYSNNRGRTAGPSPYAANSIDQHAFIDTPGYHGTLSIDPATGTVVRITIEAELGGDAPLSRAASVIEYGRMQIGDASYYCPVRSIALSSENGNTTGAAAAQNEAGPAWDGIKIGGVSHKILLINETKFTDYHRLGSTVRILTEATNQPSGPAEPLQTASASENSAAAASSPNSEAASSPALPAPPASLPAETIAAVVAPAPVVAAAAPPSSPAPPAIPEISMNAATGVPDQPINPSEPDSGFSIKVTSRLVDVGLVAYDKKGNPITDLKPEDLEVYDNGRKGEIRSFALAETTAALPATATVEPAQSPQVMFGAGFSNRVADDVASHVSAPSELGSTILVIDESHIAWSDMSYARGQILKFLAALNPGERVALYTMTSLGFRVLTEVTTDHAALIARMQKFMPSAQSLSQAQQEETQNRQSFENVHNISDLNSVNGNHSDVSDFSSPVDPQLLTMGDNPTRASFLILRQVARHLASVPGPKKVVWVSSDNVLADWRDQTVGVDKTAKDESAYALHAQEAMNEAHAAVYPFDVSQLEVGGVGADMQHANVQLTQAASDNAATAASAVGGGGAIAVNRDTTPGRITSTMTQDLHPVQGAVREVAAATGGRVIRRSGDLAAQLNRIVADGHATYMLSFSPQGPADGQYHRINIKVNGRRGLNLSYRTGYVFEKEPTTLKERFQQAIWRPADVSEIAVSAHVSAANDGADVKINIAAKDLGLREQAGRWMDRLDIFFIQRDDAGLNAHVEGQTLGLRLKSSTYQKLIPEGVPFQHFVAAKRGTGSIRVLVVDENSGRMGSVTIPSSAIGGGQGS